ncbi:MAG: hypothetical protein R3217_08920 [Gammaproteobacteria bacterium]|nr:hypothetical protein [Gammaproteobacteria bacterium]
MLFWIAAGLLLAACALLVSLPLLRQGRTSQGILLGIALAGISLGLYSHLGSPNLEVTRADSAANGQPDIGKMIVQLEKRLQDSPDDLDGWLMLARSYVVMGDYARAAESFQQALKLAGGPDDNIEIAAAYAEAQALNDPASLDGETGALFERILRMDPGNPRGLWYGGLAAQSRGNGELAVERWKLLLAVPDLPDSFRAVVENRLRSLDPDAAPPPEALVDVRVTGDALPADMPADAKLFVFIRDPSTAGPPLAAQRVDDLALPVTVSLSAADFIGVNELPDGTLEVGALLSTSGDASRPDWRGASSWSPDTDGLVTIDLTAIESAAEESDARPDKDEGIE